MFFNISSALNKFYKKNFTSPWSKVTIFLSMFLVSVFFTLDFILNFLVNFSEFIFDHFTGSYNLDLLGFMMVVFLTIIILTTKYFLSKKITLQTLINRIITVVFTEIVIYVWYDAWIWHYLVTHSIEGDSYPHGIINMVEIELNYVGAILTTISLFSILVVGKLFWPKQK
jgi:hypothetical protein